MRRSRVVDRQCGRAGYFMHGRDPRSAIAAPRDAGGALCSTSCVRRCSRQSRRCRAHMAARAGRISPSELRSCAAQVSGANRQLVRESRSRRPPGSRPDLPRSRGMSAPATCSTSSKSVSRHPGRTSPVRLGELLGDPRPAICAAESDRRNPERHRTGTARRRTFSRGHAALFKGRCRARLPA